jgi:alkylated DNA nucleotide flippase Atl1
LQQRLASAWGEFVERVADAQAPWLRVVSASGREAVQSTYAELLDGRVAAAEGRVLAL